MDFRVEFLEVWWDCCDEHAHCGVGRADLTAALIHQHLQHWNMSNTTILIHLIQFTLVVSQQTGMKSTLTTGSWTGDTEWYY